MDLQRSLLIGAIAVLSFMLLTKWVDFKDARTSALTQENTRLTAPGKPAPDLPATDAVQAEEDLPSMADSVPSVTPEEPAVSNSGRIVQIHTDVLQLAVDLEGGDIIELTLPAYPAQIDAPDVPFVLLEQNPTRTYIAQSGLIGTNGIDRNGRPTYSTASPVYKMKEGQNELVVELQWRDETGVEVTKRFTLRRGDYLIRVDFLVNNGSQNRWQANLFGQLKRDSSPAPSASSSGSMGLHPFLGAATTQPDDHFTKFTFEDMAEDPFKATLPGGWIAMIQHYFLSAWIPDPSQNHNYSTRVTSGGFNIAGFTSPPLVLDPGWGLPEVLLGTRGGAGAGGGPRCPARPADRKCAAGHSDRPAQGIRGRPGLLHGAACGSVAGYPICRRLHRHHRHSRRTDRDNPSCGSGPLCRARDGRGPGGVALP